jgi:general secretion pathway protein A
MFNFWDRISLRYVINPLDEPDTEAMITFRLRQAGYKSRKNLFTAHAINEIYHFSQGYPRRIARLCHDALEQLAVSGKEDIDDTIIQSLIQQERQLLQEIVLV